MNIMQFLEYFTAPKIIGIVFALGTLGYLFSLTTTHRAEFWTAIKGDNKVLDIIDIVILVWLVLFTSMIVADFTLELRASDHAWYSMDAIFLFAIGGKSYASRTIPPKQ